MEMSDSEMKFLHKKWRKFAQTMDTDKDGYLSKEDHLAYANKAIEVGGIDPNSVQAAQMRRKMLQTFDDLYLQINNGQPVSYDQVIRSFSERMDEVRRLQAQDFQIGFDMLDTNGDGLLQREEYRKFFYMIGLGEAEADTVFNWIDLDKDGQLDLKEFMTFGEKFFFSTDESHPSKHFFGILD